MCQVDVALVNALFLHRAAKLAQHPIPQLGKATIAPHVRARKLGLGAEEVEVAHRTHFWEPPPPCVVVGSDAECPVLHDGCGVVTPGREAQTLDLLLQNDQVIGLLEVLSSRKYRMANSWR